MKTFLEFTEEVILESLERRDSANSKKHSDLYTDENPKNTIHNLVQRCRDC